MTFEYCFYILVFEDIIILSTCISISLLYTGVLPISGSFSIHLYRYLLIVPFGTGSGSILGAGTRRASRGRTVVVRMSYIWSYDSALLY